MNPGRERMKHHRNEIDAGIAFICMWPCILSSFKFICEDKWKWGALFPAFFICISFFSQVAKAEGYQGTQDQKGRARWEHIWSWRIQSSLLRVTNVITVHCFRISASSQPEKPPEAESISGILAAAAAVVSSKGFSTNTLQGLEKWT